LERAVFALLPGQWTPVLPLTALASNPFPFEAAGERLVAFKGPEGRWHVLLDQCPHRRAALSLGRVTTEGELQCPYHGWRFRGDGACARVPLNEISGRALEQLGATAVPAREIAGALWIYTGHAPQAEPLLPQTLQGPHGEYGAHFQDWRTHWTRALENFIDFAHPPYLHRNTIGAWTHDAAERGVVARVEVEDTAFGMRIVNFLGGRSYGIRLEWYRPNLTCLPFSSGPDGMLHLFCIPLGDDLTRVMTVRRLPPGETPEDYARRAAAMDHPILDEDRVVVESQPGPVPSDPRAEISVPTDAPSVAFRRWYRAAVAGAASQGQGRNPGKTQGRGRASR
jgi:phenylpropionate dioxygenase-like ring-hydroxylating dioxygenase large terminal subunit